jgi:hypothetical protein
LAAAVAAHGVDALLTYRMVGTHGFEEKNPIAAAAMDALGKGPGLGAVKAVGFAWMAHSLHEEPLDDQEVQMFGFMLGGLFASVNNLAEVWAGPGLDALWSR